MGVLTTSLRRTSVPTYQYACTECDHAFEQVQSFTDDSLTSCPRCEGRLRKVFNAVGVVFKGSGFYRTDSRSEPKGSTDSTTSSSGESSGSQPAGGSASSSSGGDSASGSSGDSSKSKPAATSTSSEGSAA
jgi:putative FmdB family regulatory protein